MLTTSTNSQGVQRRLGPGDDGIRTVALELLHSSGYTVLQRLECEVTDAVVIVHGILPSYYLKQVAQEIILRLEGIQGVLNLVEVREPDSFPCSDNEGEMLDVRHRDECSRAADYESPASPTCRGESALNPATAILEIEQNGDILIVKPVMDLHDLGELELERVVNDLLERMDHSGVTDVFLDLHGTDVLHSQVPWLAVELWKRVQSHGGSIAIGLI